MMDSTSRIELSKSALRANIDFLRELVGERVTISAVVKGNAYGHGIEPFVNMSNALGISHFSVFSADEALSVKQSLVGDAVVMIMGQIDRDALEWAIVNDVEVFVFEKQRLLELVNTSRRIRKKARLHIELETGMHRTGFGAGQLDDVMAIIEEHAEHIVLSGLCTHYAGAEQVSNYERVTGQMELFTRFVQRFLSRNIIPESLHSACSAAAVMYPDTRMDIARIGIMLYGLWSSPEAYISYAKPNERKDDPLKRVIAWKSKIMSVNQIESGSLIGYGSSYVAHNHMTTAVVPVGYAHGFSRSLSNQGRVLINGRYCPVIGTVNMNMMVVDVSELEDPKQGDEVVLIGKQGNNEISIASFSEFSNQLNYELLTRLPQGIQRIITE